MLSKFFLGLIFICASQMIMAQEEVKPTENKLEVLVRKTELNSTDPAVVILPDDLFTLKGIRQAITAELVRTEQDSELFWAKIEDKKLTDKAEIELLRPLFTKFDIAMLAPLPTPGAIDPATATPQPANTPVVDPFQRAVLTYEFDTVKVKSLVDEIFLGLPDVSIKTFYILPDIGIDSEMTWSDVGVSKKENFSGVIIESWQKWAATQFKNFPNIVILEKDFTNRPEKLNQESVTLKWNSNLKKSEVFQDRKSARFELSAQYVLS